MDKTVKTRNRSCRHRKLRWGRVAALLCTFVLCLSVTVQAFGETTVEKCAQEQIVVTSGDSLWDLIQQYNPAYRGDMNKAIYQVKQLNHLDNAALYVGQRLFIPTGLKS